MFIIFFSIVTGGFPPDFSKIRKAYNNLQAMSQLSKQPLAASSPNIPESEKGLTDEKDVALLESYNKKRAELGEGLFGAGNTPAAAPQRDAAEAKVQPDIQAQLRDMQQEIFRLQQRVSELESQLPKKN